MENGSVAGPLDYVSKYALDFIYKMQRDHIKSMTPRQDITDKFNEHAQEWYKHTVWKDSCRAWYKNNDTGRINAVWPGSSLHYSQSPLSIPLLFAPPSCVPPLLLEKSTYYNADRGSLSPCS